LLRAPSGEDTAMPGPDLDAWLPDPAIRTCHRRVSRADPGTLWDAAESVRLRDARTLGPVVRWRIPGVPAGQTFRELFRTHPFTVLEESERCSVSGLAGRIWTLERDYPRLAGPSEFRAWDRPGTARAAARWSARRGSRPSTAAPRCACARCGRWSGASSG
jgi:hypothetical protein